MERFSSSAVSAALARRTVHIKIHPTARTFSERREVLRVLERFGEVTMFRSYKYHLKTPVPNAFLSIFKNESAAKAVVDASPMRYRLIADGESSETTEPDISISEGEAETSVLGKKVGEQEKIFELNVSHSNFDHEHYIANEPHYGPWVPVSREHSFFGGGLEVPRSLMRSGLRDWETAGLKWRNSGDETEGTGAILEGLGIRSPGADGSNKDGINTKWRIEQRRKKRLESQLKAGVMGGLKNYSDQLAKERGEKNEDHKPRPEIQEYTARNTEFGAWPGRGFRDVQREKERAATLKTSNVEEGSVR